MKTKIPPSLASAIEEHERAENALEAHRLEMDRLAKARLEAFGRMRTEQLAFDATLPECRKCRIVGWFPRGPAVIEGRTPGGALFVRVEGGAIGDTKMFRWNKQQKEFEHKTLVLRDVPSEWLPAPLASASAPS